MIRRFFSLSVNVMGKKGKGIKSEKLVPSNELSPLQTHGSGVHLAVRLKPAAKFDQISSFGQEYVEISVSSPPVDGAANTHLLKFVSQVLKIRKDQVSLHTGHKSRNKVLAITGLESDLIELGLKAAIDN